MAEEQKPMAQPQEGDSAAAAAAPAKKKGKLPVIVVLALMLAAGGFFGVKMRQPQGPVKEPEIKMGAVLPLKEFLVNLTDPGKYLRVEMELHLKEGAAVEAGGEGGEGGGGGPEMAAIRSTIIDVLMGKNSSEVQSLAGKDKLRRQLAAAINEVLERLEKEKKGETGSEAAKDEKKAEAKEGEKKAGEAERKHPEWDSDTGPVLKVYFTSFATQ